MTLPAAPGAVHLGGGRTAFRVWAPSAAHLDVRCVLPNERVVPLRRGEGGYHEAVVDDVRPGTLYYYRFEDGRERPDPASRHLPDGVRGPSAVVDASFAWTDSGWYGIPLASYVIYELHMGTFSEEGTFDGAIRRLDMLVELGVTAVELMPVAQFPGERNWGYDAVQPYAVQHSYGGPDGFRRLVDACHGRGLAVVLDVVYNHIGPEGNYLPEFGPYFTDRYRTPWGPAINFDGPDSDAVRRYFIENALYWITDYHIDALRLDAVHAIVDMGAKHILQEIAEEVAARAERLNRRVHLIAESDLNDPRVTRSGELGGYGLDAQWSDDFHHSVHALLTGERTGYYQDYGRVEHLARSFRDGFVYAGEYSNYRRRRHGQPPGDLPGERFVVCIQNHDQVGNRMKGERLASLVSFEALKLAAGTLLLSPFVPLLFMGEEYGEQRPFPYFVSHSDPELVEAVRRGRSEEFAAFSWAGEPPDPQSGATFAAAKLEQELLEEDLNRTLRELYRQLLRFRRELPPLQRLARDSLEAVPLEDERVLYLRRWAGEDEAVALFHFGGEPVAATVPLPDGRWLKRMDSAAVEWDGPGTHVPDRLTCEGGATFTLSPWAFVLLTRAL